MSTDPKPHPLAELFPLMEGDDYAELRDDIKANGLREPILLHEGKVLDGRNRLRACRDAGIEPKFREWDGKGSAVAYVVSMNIHRRHLTSSQRAAIATDVEIKLAEEAKERQRANARATTAQRTNNQIIDDSSRPKREAQASEQAAKIMKTNRQYVSDAKAIKEKAPELFQKVKSGAVSIPEAKRVVQREERLSDLKKKAEAAPAPTKATPQIWQIHTGDCIEAIPHHVKPGTVRLAFADPPYNQGVDYGKGAKADKLPDHEYLAWCKEWIEAVARTLTPDGSFWVLISDEYADEFARLLRVAGLHRKQWLIWYESFGVYNSANRGFARSSRHLLWYVKDQSKFVFNPEPVTRESWRQRNGDKRADPAGRTWDSVWGIDPPIARLVDNSKERIPEFPTQLPLALLRPIVGCASDPNDLVMDPFNGSGTTGDAAVALGRQYVGFEKNTRFAELARLRLQGVKPDGSNS